MESGPGILTPRWYPLRYHGPQSRLWRSRKRFRVVPAGRRSGKTELAKRKGVIRGISEYRLADGWGVFAAPTRDQGKRIFWTDLKALSPRRLVKSISESDLSITYVNGWTNSVIGMDKPERIEGRPLDWVCCDEFANMRESAWSKHIRPALSTPNRLGEAWLIGVPEGRNHYWRMKVFAEQPENADEWEVFTWPSSDIVDPSEIEAAKRDLDPMTFAQEYEGDFLNFEGRAYYPFRREESCRPLDYDPNRDLILCLDFNVSPGTGAILQEQALEVDGELRTVTCCVGEIWIPKDSNTPAVCRKFLKDWGKHEKDVYVYGDATGGARGTSRVEGSDWELVRKELRGHFGERLKIRVQARNPPERVRVNAMNARIMTADGRRHFFVDPRRAPHVVDDYEGVTLLEGGSGELDKSSDPNLTHLSDGIGYYVAYKFPLIHAVMEVQPV